MRVEDRLGPLQNHFMANTTKFRGLCASSDCGVSVERMNVKKPMIRSIYQFEVYYHIRRILKIMEIPLPYENSLNQYNNPYNHEKFMRICNEYGVSNDLTKWRNQKYLSTLQIRA